MNSKAEQLRSLPAVDEVLREEALANIIAAFPHTQVVDWVRGGIEACRQQILAEQPLEGTNIESVIDSVIISARHEQASVLQHVINATGVVLHTNLGRAPLPDEAVERMQSAAAYSNVELDLVGGRRSKRGSRAARLLKQLTGVEDAVIVNNCASATMLVLQAIASGREVIVSRGQLVEIGGGFRLPDVFRAAGVVLREVGTTNRTYLRDYENAVGEETGAIIRVHRSNFKQSGFVTEPSIDEMVSAKRPDHVPVIDDIGSGCMDDLTPLGFDEPTVHHSIAAGADMTLFSGDKLFGGPQCGMVVGRKVWIDKLRSSPIMRAVRVDKITLAALEATLEIHLAGEATAKLPLQRMLFRTADEVRSDCERVASELGGCSANVSVTECESQVGGGSIPGGTLPSFGIKITGAKIETIATALRMGDPPVQSRVAQDSIVLDLRTVAEKELPALIRRSREVLATAERG